MNQMSDGEQVVCMVFLVLTAVSLTLTVVGL